ncbi:hypothetical protein EV421DRAFT_2023435 [Armillaria borealis]|uniref:Uncharacterized protein n=1 Tax=Armillaria borealis TaxID=47425 RepID=A0AA39J297_9AGAR|nr:hypothetical protein EV421DRAFT_2023435 [Armillaria borealis]
MTEWSTMIVWKQDEDVKESGTVLGPTKTNATGRQARYTDAGSKHRNGNTTVTQTQEQRCTGTQPERKHRNHNARERKGTQTQENENGTGKKRFSKARETREKEAHDEPERPAQTANLVGEILDELFAIVEREAMVRWLREWVVVEGSTKPGSDPLAELKADYCYERIEAKIQADVEQTRQKDEEPHARLQSKIPMQKFKFKAEIPIEPVPEQAHTQRRPVFLHLLKHKFSTLDTFGFYYSMTRLWSPN